jgi:hypothetical protein
MASPLKLTNNAIGRLTAGMSAVDTTATLVSGNGALFPTLGVGEFFPATIIRASDLAREIVKVTARSTDVLTVARAQEGTSALVFIAGDRVELRLTAGALSTEIARVEAVADAAQSAADAAQASADAADAAADAVSAAALLKAGGTMTGDIGFSGNGRRISADLSNATEANRLMFQTATSNGASYVGTLPNGSGVTSGFVAYGGSAPANTAGFLAALIGGNEARLSSFKNGTGTYAPMTFHTGGSERMRIATDGKVSLNGGTLIADPSVTTSSLLLSGGTQFEVDGASIALRGSTAATNPHCFELYTFGNEVLRVDSLGQQSSVVPGGTVLYNEFKCRAWVNFNGTGTVAIRASGNVSSVTDNGVGDYTINFSTNMPDTNYCAVSMPNRESGEAGARSLSYTGSTKNEAGMRVENETVTDGSNRDNTTLMVAFFR